MCLDCSNDDPGCEDLVDMFLNNYCESVKLPTMLVAPSMTTKEMTTVPV